MKLNLAESIREVLLDRKSVSIYGLGTLRLKQIASQYGPNRKSLYPPTVELEFTETSSTNSELIEWLCVKYSVEKSQAESAIKQFSERVLNMFLNARSVNLPGVVSFHRQEDNTIQVKTDKSIKDSFYAAFPEVKLEIPDTTIIESVISAISEVDEVVTDPVTEKSVSETEVEEPELKEEIASSSDEENEVSNKDETESAESSIDNESEESAEDTEDKLEEVEEGTAASRTEVFDLQSELEQLQLKDIPADQFQKIIEKAEENQIEDKNRKLNNIWGTLLILFSIVLACILLVDACKHFDLFGGEEKAASPTEEMLDLAQAGAGDAGAGAMLDKEITTTTTDSCIIITGVFSSQRNVDLMLEKVASQGYQTYTSRIRNYTRVGLSFDCNEETDLEQFIRTIRSEISPEAWYLNPELYVAYLE